MYICLTFINNNEYWNYAKHTKDKNNVKAQFLECSTQIYTFLKPIVLELNSSDPFLVEVQNDKDSIKKTRYISEKELNIVKTR